MICYLFISKKNKFGFDDTLDAFGIHGIGGIVGALFLIFFIRDSWMAQAATNNGGSWSVWQQLGVQATAVGLSILYAAVLTFVILIAVDKLFKLRSASDEEMKGLDTVYHGESGYGMLNPN
jgi:ammonium transporter, Amt family